MDRGMFRHAHITLDVNEFEPVAPFWGVLLGQTPGPVRSDGEYLTVGELRGGGWPVLQKVPEQKAIKNRMHPGLTVGDVDGATTKITRLGEKRISGPRPGGGVTMTDPEGNEFCVAAFERSKEGVRTPVEEGR